MSHASTTPSRAAIVAVALAVACTRAPHAEAPTQVEMTVPAPATEPSAPPEIHAPPPAAPTTPPRIESVTVIEHGLGQGPVLAWPTDGAGQGTPAVVLFEDEQRAVRRAVASGLRKHGVEVLSLDELERIEDAAAAGRLALEGDQRCASPLSRDEVMARYFLGQAKARIDETCFDTCRLAVTVERGGAEPIYLDSGVVRHPEDPKRWRAAAVRLTDEIYGIGGLGLSGTSHSPPIRFDAPGWVGAWSTPPDPAQFSALEPAAAACAHPDPMVGLTHTIRARVDGRGQVDRCAVASPVGVGRPEDEACLCGAIRTVRFGRGAANRRFRVDAIDDGGFVSAPGLTLMQPGTEVWIDRIVAVKALEQCSASSPLRVALDAVLSLQLAADGSVEDVRIDGEVRDTDTMRWATCVVGRLGSIALPCRPPGIDVLRVRLSFKPPA